MIDFSIFSQFFHRESALINNSNTLLVLAVILITGYIFTKIGEKLKIPTVTAQIIGGIVIGHYVLFIFPEQSYISFKPITNFALGFIGLLIGSHLNFWKLHNAGKRILSIALTDVVLTPIIVFISLKYVAHLSWEISLILSTISIATAPGSILHIIREKRAKGIFSKTLLAVVALNNVLTILIFYVAYYFIFYRRNISDLNIFYTLCKPLLLLLESIVIGGIVGFVVIYFSKKKKIQISFLSLVVLAIVVITGESELLHISGILPSLILGIVLTNFSHQQKTFFGAFKHIEKEVFTLFFVLAGTHLNFGAIKYAGYTGAIFIFARLIGKTVAPTLGATLAGSTQNIRKHIGFALYPIAGVAIGLVLLVNNSELFPIFASQLTAIVLTAVVVNELIGPILTGKAIKLAGEEHKDRIRLMDFVQEEFIKINLEAENKWDALNEMVIFMYKTHKIREISLKELQKSITKREKEISTGIGGNLAIPHAIIDEGPNIRGVIGVSQAGIPFDSIDEKPVHIIFLIATPRAYYDTYHLQMLANIAKIFGLHPNIKEKIIQAESPEEVFAIFQAEEVEKLNPFFED
ncbi:MAG: PTS sugar transporter subunit IIA [Candidatus Cloacimonadota bacterium]|nr:PTS sugar transporter subunit IIA [Candidatus Cloacimonadota bacterium]